jgi:hypothetical protein
MPPIRVTSTDISRVKAAVGAMTPFMFQCLDRPRSIQLFSPQFVSVLVHDALGGPGTLTDALDVLDDSGGVPSAVFGTLMVGWADAVLVNVSPGGHRHTFYYYTYDHGTGRTAIPTIERLILACEYDTIVFRPGIVARLTTVPFSYHTIHPDDISRVRDRWDVGPAIPGHPVDIKMDVQKERSTLIHHINRHRHDSHPT